MTAIETALFVRPEVFRNGLVFALVSLFLSIILPRERRRMAHLALLYGAALLLRPAAALLQGSRMPGAADTVHFLALLLEGFAFLGAVWVLLFAALLRLLLFETPRIVRDLAIALSYLVLVLYNLSLHHVDVTGIVATSAVVTAVIGFSLQETLVNVMGGVALQLDGGFEVGAWLKVGDVSGIVREIGWRHTALETTNGDVLLVPNSVLMKSPALLRGRPAGAAETRERRWITFNVDYRYTPAAVLEAVNDALHRGAIPHVAESPAPDAVLMGFEKSWALYAVRYWLTDIWKDDPTDSAIRTRVFYGLRRAGIPLSIPAQTLFVESEDEGRRERHLERDRASRLVALERVPLFQTLSAEERELLAGVLIPAPFAPGESMVVQGRTVHHLYVLAKGSAEVQVAVEGTPPRPVSTLTAPDFFGEMGMLTGEPRKATVVALTEVDCWRLEKERFAEVLATRPAIASEISHVLASRDVELTAAREGLSEEAKRRRYDDEHGSLLLKIERFFGLA